MNDLSGGTLADHSLRRRLVNVCVVLANPNDNVVTKRLAYAKRFPWRGETRRLKTNGFRGRLHR